MPVRIDGTHAVITFLMVVVFFGSLHLLASAKPSAKISQAWIALGF